VSECLGGIQEGWTVLMTPESSSERAVRIRRRRLISISLPGIRLMKSGRRDSAAASSALKQCPEETKRTPTENVHRGFAKLEG
jgi:hypothetical protein